MSLLFDSVALDRSGLRFVEPATEAAYRTWRVRRALRFARLGTVSGIVAWCGILVAIYAGIPERFAESAALIVLLIQPLQIAALASTYTRRWQQWAMPLMAVSNGVAGFLTIVVAMVAVGTPGVAAAAVTLLVYHAFTIFRMPPLLALLAVSPYVALTLVILARAYLDGLLTRADLTGYCVPPLAAMVTGVMVCVEIERAARETFHNERVIEQQQEALAGERANLSKFLAPEVAALVREQGIEATLTQHSLPITAVCCDLRGFTAYTEQHGAAQMAVVLREYYEIVIDVARRYGGTVKDFAGDGALVLVGAPLPRDDHAEAGVSLARDLLAAVERLTSRAGSESAPLGIGAGVASGICAVGAIGSQNRLEYTAIGAPVNLAARLCAHAGHRQILIAPATATLVPSRSEWQSTALHLKGFDGPIAAVIETVS